MNQIFKNDHGELTAKHEEMLRYDLNKKINYAKKEIQIFVNAVKGLEKLGENRVSTDYMKCALLSVLEELKD